MEMQAPEKQLEYEVKNGIAWVTLLKNTITPEFSLAFHDVLDELEQMDDVRVVIFKSAHPRIFFAGADLKGITDLSKANLPNVRKALWEAFRLTYHLEHFQRPTIACVDGASMGGGCEFALACDFILASEKAKFGFPEVKRGLIASAGGTHWMPRFVGKHKAMELLLTGRDFTAQEAFDLGLVYKVVSSEGLYDEAQSLAELIAENAPIAVRVAKMCVVNSMTMFDMQIGCETVDASLWNCFRSTDIVEGVLAWMQKRKPEFKGLKDMP